MDQQSDNSLNPNDGGGRRRRRRRRKNRKRTGEGGEAPFTAHASDSGSKAASGQDAARQRRRPSSKRPERKFMDAFTLFAFYHLGLDENNKYRKIGIREIARRFSCTQNDIRDGLRRYYMDRESLMLLSRVGFNIADAELDIRVAPDGIDKGELAKTLFQDFIEMGQRAGLFTELPSSTDEDDDLDDEDDDHDAHDDAHDDDDAHAHDDDDDDHDHDHDHDGD